MSFDEGMKLFKAANYRAAAEQFADVTEKDENNHKAWNALGICLSKIGEYESAATCFENAVTLAPDNTTYKKNQAGNDKKRESEPDLELDPEPTKQEVKVINAQYQRNWWQIPIYFIPMILSAINLPLGMLAVIGGVYYIKTDAESLNAGMNPNGSFWGKLKGWEWMLLFIFFWLFMPIYSWKREQIYKENIGFGIVSSRSVSSSEDLMWKYIKYVGGFLLFVIVVAMVSSAMNPMHQTSSSVKSQNVAPALVQQVSTPTPTPSKDQLSYTFSGSSSGSTPYFYLERGMADILFNVGGQYYNGATLKDADGNYIDLVINQAKPGEGNKRIRIPKSGDYYLDMHAEGWDVKITQ